MSYEPGIIVRMPEDGDLEELASLIKRFHLLNEEFDPAWSLREDADGLVRDLAMSYISGRDGLVLVAEYEGSLVGYIRVVFRDKPLLRLARMAVIEELYVVPRMRGRGVARLLIDHAERMASSRGARVIAAEFPHENSVAEDFYKRSGFRRFACIFIKEAGR